MSISKEINGVNYSIQRHHKQVLRAKIQPQTIQQIQIAINPSKNYMNAFKTVYNDELQKTLILQQQKKNYQKEKENILNHSAIYGYDGQSLQNSRLGEPLKYQEKKMFTDYNEERQAKFDTLINRSLNPNTFFKQQDQYKHKQHQTYMNVQSALKNQLKAKQETKFHEKEQHLKEHYKIRENQVRQQQMQRTRFYIQSQKKKNLSNEIMDQIQIQKLKRNRRSNFQYQNIARHNPITNPIEYHIDNPYILNSFQDKIRNSPHK